MDDDTPSTEDARFQSVERDLSLTRQRLDWLAEGCAAAVFFSEADGTLTYVNPAAVAMLGYGDGSELVGQLAEVLYHDPKQRALAREVLGLQGRIDPMQIVFRRADGTPLPAMGRVLMLREPGGAPAGIIGFFEDISHRTDLQGQVDYQAHLLGSIRKVLDMPGQCEEMAEAWEGCLRVAMTLTESRIGAIGEFGPDGRFQIRGVEPGEGHPSPPRDALPIIDPKGLLLWIRQEGVSVITNKPAGHPMFAEPPPGHPRIDTFLGVPLHRGGQVFGLIGLGNRTGGYAAEDRAGVETLATAIVRALVSGVGEASM